MLTVFFLFQQRLEQIVDLPVSLTFYRCINQGKKMWISLSTTNSFHHHSDQSFLQHFPCANRIDKMGVNFHLISHTEILFPMRKKKCVTFSHPVVFSPVKVVSPFDWFQLMTELEYHHLCHSWIDEHSMENKVVIISVHDVL